jgi:hypothetical protein
LRLYKIIGLRYDTNSLFDADSVTFTAAKKYKNEEKRPE